MKGKFLIAVCIVTFIVLGILYFSFFNIDGDGHVGDFSLNEYCQYIQSYNKYKSYGVVSKSSDACKAAEDMWCEVYGKNVSESKPYDVYYDRCNGIWLVKGCKKKDCGMPYIMIRENDGKVLGVWYN